MGEIEVSFGEYELEEPWGRLVEVGRASETIDSDLPGPITTYVLKDRTIRASSITCKSIEDAIALARFLDAHLAELRRFLLEQVEGDQAQLRALETDVAGKTCSVTWALSTGNADPREATDRAVEALHDRFLSRLAPVDVEEARLESALDGGIAVLAVHSDEVRRVDLHQASGPGYRDVQLTVVRDWPRIGA